MESSNIMHQSHRERRKTAYEIFFEEEPVFSDSEDEAEFLRLNFGTSAEQPIVDKTVPEKNACQLPDSLSERILKVCCDVSECPCCQRIKDVIDPSLNSFPVSSPSTLSFDSGFGNHRYTKRKKLTNEKENTSNKINIISSHTVVNPQSALRSSHFNHIVGNNTQSQEQYVLSSVDKNIQEKVQTSNTKTTTVNKTNKKRMSKSHKARKPKSDQPVKNIVSDPEQNTDDKPKGSSTNILSEKSEDRPNDIFDKLIEGLKKASEKSTVLTNRPKDSEHIPKLPSNVNSDTQRENIFDTQDAVHRKTLTLRDSKKPGESVRQKLNFVTNSLKKAEEENAQNNNVITHRKSTRAKRQAKMPRKSLPNTSEASSSTDASSEWQSRSLITMDDFEPRRSSREQKPLQKYVAGTVSQSRRKSDGKKFVYSTIDKRIFKIPIDTTTDRNFTKAIARKLARRAGSNLCVDSLSIENENFRFQAAQKIKKLYSPDDWLNSNLFSMFCGSDS